MTEYSELRLLRGIGSAEDLRKLSNEELNELADEIMSELSTTFDVSGDQARSWLAIGSSEEPDD